jgi:hypothetical protein
LKEPIDGLWAEGEREYGRILTEFGKSLETYILTHPEQCYGIYMRERDDEWRDMRKK